MERSTGSSKVNDFYRTIKDKAKRTPMLLMALKWSCLWKRRFSFMPSATPSCDYQGQLLNLWHCLLTSRCFSVTQSKWRPLCSSVSTPPYPQGSRVILTALVTDLTNIVTVTHSFSLFSHNSSFLKSICSQQMFQSCSLHACRARIIGAPGNLIQISLHSNSVSCP